MLKMDELNKVLEARDEFEKKLNGYIVSESAKDMLLKYNGVDRDTFYLNVVRKKPDELSNVRAQVIEFLYQDYLKGCGKL
ncbi:hypothetical protein ACUXJ9_002594 [Staphylococcus caledonicus]